MPPLTLPDQDGFYGDLVAHPNVLRVVALSRRVHPRRRQRPAGPEQGDHGKFSRALTEGLSAQQSDAEFDAASWMPSIKAIYEASIA